MKTSTFFLSTLIAAAAMTANAYGATLEDAVLSIDSFTTGNIGSLTDAGWTVSNFTGTLFFSALKGEATFLPLQVLIILGRGF
jgi:hypothetical protein